MAIIIGSTVFFGVLHPRNVHNLMGWVQEYEKKSNEKVRFPYSCTLSMYSKNENFFDTSPLISLIHLVQQAKEHHKSNRYYPSPLICLIHLVQYAKDHHNSNRWKQKVMRTKVMKMKVMQTKVMLKCICLNSFTPPPSFVSFILSNTQSNTKRATDGSRR